MNSQTLREKAIEKDGNRQKTSWKAGNTTT
jgi:hypothetical protein